MRNFLFKNKTVGQTIVKNTFWLVAGEGVSRTLRAIVVIYAFRVLGAASYGAFAFAMAISNFTAIFADLGVTSIIGREVSKDHSTSAKYFTNGLALKGILLALNVVVILFIIPPLIKIPEALPLLPLVALILIFDTLRDFCMAFFRALERMEWDALVKIVMNIGIALLGFYWLKTLGTAYSLVNSYVLGTIFGLVLAAGILFTHSRQWFTRIDRQMVKNLAAISWPIGLLYLAGAFNINTDMIMLGWMTSPTAVGLYAAAQRPIQLFYVFPGLIASAMFPVMARAIHGAPERMRQLLEQGSKVTLLFALPLAIGGIILAPVLIPAVYDASAMGATLSFQILLLTLLTVFPFAVVNNTILAYNRQTYFVRFFLVGAAFNIIFNALLIPPLGIAGAAASTVCAQLITNGLTWHAVKKLNQFSLLRGTLRLFIATALMGVIAWVFVQNGAGVMTTLGVSVIAYFLFLLALREPLLKDFKAILKPATVEIS